MQKKIGNEPKWFVEKFLGYEYWSGLNHPIVDGRKYFWQKQLEIMESVRDHENTAVIGCTGSSKTFGAGFVALWWICSGLVGRVFTVAPSYRQVEMNLWGYIDTLWREALIPLGGRLMSGAEWQISKDCYAKGFSVKQPENVAGIHGKRDLLILDDTHAIPKPVIDAMERARAGGTCKILWLANPLVVTGEVYDAFHRNKKLYNLIKIPAQIVPNYLVEEDWEKKVSKKVRGRLREPTSQLSQSSDSRIPKTQSADSQNSIESSPDSSKSPAQLLSFRKTILPYPKFPLPGAIIKSKCDEWLSKFGLYSDYYRVMVLSEFPQQQSDTLIPLDWLSQAQQRDLPPQDRLGKSIILGIDVARFGDDRSVISPLRGRMALPQWEYRKFDTMHLSQQILSHAHALNARLVAVDSIGIGAGVVDRLTQLGLDVVPINVGFTNLPLLFDPLTEKRRFSSLRSLVWWRLREAFDPSNPNSLKIPHDDQDLVAELSSVKYFINDQGVIEIQSKNEMKRPENLGYSSDKADALALALYAQQQRHELQTGIPIEVISAISQESSDFAPISERLSFSQMDPRDQVHHRA